ncbi:MAG TPA: S8 family serine peptidase [Verrucomicrobiae bacterium]
MNGSLYNSISLLRTLFAVGALLFLTANISAAQPVKAKMRTDRIIVQPKAGVSQDEINALQGHRRTLKHIKGFNRMRVVQLDSADELEQTLARYRASGLVEFAEPDHLLKIAASPNDPHFNSGAQWSLRNSGRDISATTAWDITKTAPEVIVAVIDSGIRYTHEDLRDNMWRNPGETPGNGIDDDGNGLRDDVYGINAVRDTGDPMDDNNHGTHVAGIVGAVGNNGKGIAGVAWNVKLMACKFLGADGYGWTSDGVECVNYAVENGADVINASFGGGEFSQAMFTAIQAARNAGIIFVAAAGNEQTNIDQTPTYPANYGLNNVVVVGASTRDDQWDTEYSNYGATKVELFAPGTSILSTWGSGDTAYQSISGTSMAAPHVAGAFALMKARFTNLSTVQIIDRLLTNVDPIANMAGRCRTGGRLNLNKALGPNPWANFGVNKLLGEAPLVVSLTNLSLGPITGHTWDFGDGSPTSTEMNPKHIFTRTGDYNVRLSVTSTSGQVNTMTKVVRVVSNYAWSSATYSWIAPGTTKVALTDNGSSGPHNLPFAFNFYGVPQSSVYISANGFLSFGTDGIASKDNVSLPSGTAPNGIIAPYWDDLNPAGTTSANGVFVTTTGTAPNRKFVVTWRNVPRVANQALQSFQAILEEGTDAIVFQYQTTDGGRSATVGLENPAGDVAALYSHNGSPVVLAASRAIRAGSRPFRYLIVQQSNLAFDLTQGAASPSLTLDLENPGNASLNWTIAPANSWLTVNTGSGSLAGGEKKQVQVQLSAAGLALSPGDYQTSLNVENTTDDNGSGSIPVTVRIQGGGVAILEFTPSNSAQFSGLTGGPFSPAPISLTVRNGGNAPLQWSATPNQSWIQLDPASGQLSPGQSASLQLGVSAAANTLAAGAYNGSVEFRNLSTIGSATIQQAISLNVSPRVSNPTIHLQNGQFRASIPAPQSGSYAVEYSTDLTNWETLTTASDENGVVSFVDPVGAGRRFYRLRSN